MIVVVLLLSRYSFPALYPAKFGTTVKLTVLVGEMNKVRRRGGTPLDWKWEFTLYAVVYTLDVVVVLPPEIYFH